MTESDYYNRKIARQLDAQQRLEREALKAGPTIGDYLMLAAAGIIGIAGGYLIAAYIGLKYPEALEPARPVSASGWRSHSRIRC